MSGQPSLDIAGVHVLTQLGVELLNARDECEERAATGQNHDLLGFPDRSLTIL